MSRGSARTGRSAHFLPSQLRVDQRRRADNEINMAGNSIVQGRATPAIGHMGQVNAKLLANRTMVRCPRLPAPIVA